MGWIISTIILAFFLTIETLVFLKTIKFYSIDYSSLKEELSAEIANDLQITNVKKGTVFITYVFNDSYDGVIIDQSRAEDLNILGVTVHTTSSVEDYDFKEANFNNFPEEERESRRSAYLEYISNNSLMIPDVYLLYFKGGRIAWVQPSP